MKKSSSIVEIIETFFGATGITTFFIDTLLDIQYIKTEFTLGEFHILDMDEVFDFLENKFMSECNKVDNYYTFITRNNCFYNIKFRLNENQIHGAVVSGPMILPSPTESQVAVIYDQFKHKINRNEVVDIFSKVAKVSIAQITNLGKLLASIVTLNESLTDQQILQGNIQSQHNDEIDIISIRKINVTDKASKTQYIKPSIYDMVKQIIITGDIQQMKQYVASLNFNSLDQLIPENSIQSAKSICISIASACFCFSRETKVPYNLMMELTNEFIREVEKQNSLNEIVSLIKTMLMSYTNAVAMYPYHSYSKPVMKAMKYIQSNYKRKITLEELSEHIGLSTFYLSSLIKKETLLSLSDNINKIRVEESKHLLLKTDASILDIAQRMGFSYQNHYSLVFKKFIGKTPKEFRDGI